jgi:hypothetical protein
MAPSLTAAVIWVLAGTACAMLPVRRQMVPGLALLLAAPLLIAWIGRDHGWLAAVPAALAFVSMFRNPLRHLANRALGRPAALPPGLRRDEDPPR